MRHLEAVEQRIFVKRWRMDPRTRDLPACAIPNGVRTSALQAKLAKADGMSAGAPDWVLFVPRPVPGHSPFHGLCLEFKSPTGKGRLSPAQQEWHDRLALHNYRIVTVTSADAAWWVVADYLGFTP